MTENNFTEYKREGIEILVKYHEPKQFFDMDIENDWYYVDTLHDAIKFLCGKPVYDSLFDNMQRMPKDCSPMKIDDEWLVGYSHDELMHTWEIYTEDNIYTYDENTDKVTTRAR